jgi:hypothetical protein
VLRTVLQEKGAAAIWTLDGSRRTALHVAAYCGNYEAFQTFVAKDKSVDLLSRFTPAPSQPLNLIEP